MEEKVSLKRLRTKDVEWLYPIILDYITKAHDDFIIHGKEDKVVDYSNAGYLEKNLKCEHKLITIDGGDHNLTRESDLNIIKENIISWIKKHS